MKAMMQHRFGPASELSIREVERPAIDDNEVLLRVRAAGVGPDVWHMVTGRPLLARVAGAGVLRPKSPIPGRDVAGVVDAVGSRVHELKPGDEVFGVCRGAFAEYAVTTTEMLAPKPTNLTFAQAAAVPISGCAALHALRDAGRVAEGQSVLIIGASGGVGTFAVQLAKMFGAHVTGVCSSANADLVRSIGADAVIDYAQGDFTRGTSAFDVIVDAAGRRRLADLRRILAPRGTLVIVGGEGGGNITGGFGRQLRAMMWSPLVRQRLRALVSVERRDDLLYLKEKIEAGAIMPVIGRTLALEDVAVALRDDSEGHGRGKSVALL